MTMVGLDGAFSTAEAVERILNTTVENIQSFIDGEPENAVLGAEQEKSPG